MEHTAAAEISARKTAVRLFLVAGFVVLAHVASVTAWYRDLLPVDDWLYYAFFDLDEEESIGTWFSALLLFIAGQLTWLQARLLRGQRGSKRGWWWLLAVGFHLLSLEEVAGLHEFLNTVVEGTHWTTFGAAAALVVAIIYLPFLMALPARTRRLFILAGAIYLGGAVGVEWGTIWYEDNGLLDTLAYNLWNALEEGMEMGGVILFIFALLEYIARTTNGRALIVRFLA